MRDPATIERIDRLLASANQTINTVMARAFVEKFEIIERIDRLIAIVEGRRNMFSGRSIVVAVYLLSHCVAHYKK